MSKDKDVSVTIAGPSAAGNGPSDQRGLQYLPAAAHARERREVADPLTHLHLRYNEVVRLMIRTEFHVLALVMIMSASQVCDQHSRHELAAVASLLSLENAQKLQLLLKIQNANDFQYDK